MVVVLDFVGCIKSNCISYGRIACKKPSAVSSG